MSSLAELPEVVGFFSYSRDDDEAFRGSLSALNSSERPPHSCKIYNMYTL